MKRSHGSQALALQARAKIEWKKRQQVQAADPNYCADPLQRLFDPNFLGDADGRWKYAHSHVGRLPAKLHAKQIEFLHDPHMHRWSFWSNQGGKTAVHSIDMVLSALGRHPRQLAGLDPMPPFEGWASALSWQMWENVLLPELLSWIPFDRIIRAPAPRRSTMTRDIEIRADNGALSLITGKSAEQGAAKYQSARVDRVWMDEEHPYETYEEIHPRLVAKNGTMTGSMTPLLGRTWVFAQVYEPVKSGDVEVCKYHWYSHSGMADNPGIPRTAIEAITRELSHNPSRLASRLYGFFTQPQGVVYNFDLEKDGITLEGEPLKEFIASANCYGHVDFGKWRFAFAFGGVDPNGTLIMVDEVFSQNEDMPARAKRIDQCLKRYGIKTILIYGDCAAPDDLLLLNQCFANIDAPWMVIPVEMQFKSRPHGVERVQSLIARGALKMRRTMGSGVTWMLGMKSNSDGKPVHTSRWLYEIQNWAYPVMPDGKAQTDDPDDDTADGADMMDGLRYLVMQWLGPVHVDTPVKNAGNTIREIVARDLERLRRMQNATDEYEDGLSLQQG